MVGSKSYRSIGIFVLPLMTVLYFTDVILTNKVPSNWEIFSIIGVIFMAAFAVTYKITLNENGIEFRCLLLPFMNDTVPWKDIKRVKWGVLLKELEFYSKRRDAVVSVPVSGMTGKLYRVIMDELGQKNIES